MECPGPGYMLVGPEASFHGVGGGQPDGLQPLDYGFDETNDIGRRPGVAGIGGDSPAAELVDGFRARAEEYGPVTLDGFGPSPHEDLSDIDERPYSL